LSATDPRNEHIMVLVNGQLVSRQDARISVFDSVVQGGDAVPTTDAIRTTLFSALEANGLTDEAHIRPSPVQQAVDYGHS